MHPQHGGPGLIPAHMGLVIKCDSRAGSSPSTSVFLSVLSFPQYFTFIYCQLPFDLQQKQIPSNPTAITVNYTLPTKFNRLIPHQIYTIVSYFPLCFPSLYFPPSVQPFHSHKCCSDNHTTFISNST